MPVRTPLQRRLELDLRRDLLDAKLRVKLAQTQRAREEAMRAVEELRTKLAALDDAQPRSA